MKKNLFKYIIFIFLSLAAGKPIDAQILDLDWAKKMGGTGFDIATDLVVDANGNTYVTGGFHGTVDFDPGPGTFNLSSAGKEDVFIVKLNPLGNFVFALRIGGPEEEAANAITTDGNGNIYTTGWFGGTCDFDPGNSLFNLTSYGVNDVFISKITPAGNFVWAKQMGGPNPDGLSDMGNSIAIDPNGNVLTCGTFSSTGDFDPGPGVYSMTSKGSADLFITKLDANGNFLWALQVGGTGIETVNQVITDNLGNVYSVGRMGSDINGVDFDPGPGVFKVYSEGLFVYKLDASGNFIWAKAFTNPLLNNSLSGYSSSIALDATGNIYTTGFFSGTIDLDPGPANFALTSTLFGYDIYLMKMNKAGDFVWAKQMTSNVYGWVNQSNSIAVSGDVILLAGQFYGTMDFDPGPAVNNRVSDGIYDIFISSFDNSGNFIDVKQMGGTDMDVGYSIKADTGGNVYIAGSFNQTVDFNPCAGTYNLTSDGDHDGFIAKFSSYPIANISASSTTICSGQSLSFSASTLNEGQAPTYQWLVNDIVVSTNSKIYSASNLTDSDVVKFQLIRNTSCTPQSLAISNPVIVHVNPLLSVTPGITISYSPTNICYDSKVTFNAISSNGGMTPIYQWKRNGMNVGLNSSTFTDDNFIDGDKVSCMCKLPQKQYVLKVDKSLNFKNVKDEKESIQSQSDCQHTQGV